MPEKIKGPKRRRGGNSDSIRLYFPVKDESQSWLLEYVAQFESSRTPFRPDKTELAVNIMYRNQKPLLGDQGRAQIFDNLPPSARVALSMPTLAIRTRRFREGDTTSDVVAEIILNDTTGVFEPLQQHFYERYQTVTGKQPRINPEATTPRIRLGSFEAGSLPRVEEFTVPLLGKTVELAPIAVHPPLI